MKHSCPAQSPTRNIWNFQEFAFCNFYFSQLGCRFKSVNLERFHDKFKKSVTLNFVMTKKRTIKHC